MRWSQKVIELADGDPTRGNFLWGSPLAAALAMRGAARWNMGRSGWRDDLEQAVAIAGGTDRMSQALVITYKYFVSIPTGVLLPHDTALCEIDEALQIAERSGDDQALGLAQLTMGLTLVHRGAEDRDRGFEVLAPIRDMCLHERFILSELPIVEVWTAFVRAKRGDHDLAISPMRKALDDLFDEGQFAYCVAATGVLVDTLLNRGGEGLNRRDGVRNYPTHGISPVGLVLVRRW